MKIYKNILIAFFLVIINQFLCGQNFEELKNGIDVLKKMGRPIAEVRAMKNEEAVVCSLTGTPAEFNQDY